MDKYNQKWVSKLFNKKQWAITIGQTTYYSESEEYVNNDPKWQRHEDKHKEQWRRNGYFKFALKYLWYQIKFGYQNNPYEVEARSTETLGDQAGVRLGF